MRGTWLQSDDLPGGDTKTKAGGHQPVGPLTLYHSTTSFPLQGEYLILLKNQHR